MGEAGASGWVGGGGMADKGRGARSRRCEGFKRHWPKEEGASFGSLCTAWAWQGEGPVASDTGTDVCCRIAAQAGLVFVFTPIVLVKYRRYCFTRYADWQHGRRVHALTPCATEPHDAPYCVYYFLAIRGWLNPYCN